MLSFPLTNSIIFQDGKVAPPTSIEILTPSNPHLIRQAMVEEEVPDAVRCRPRGAAEVTL